jgi:polyvinyl alcohol dehydrogenase (cytochrome)
VDGKRIYVGTPDQKTTNGPPTGGLTALDIQTGKVIWHKPPPPAVCSWGNAGQTITAAFGATSCSPSQPGALAAMPGVVFSGSIDGHIRAYLTQDGTNIWDADTAQTWDAVNGAKATGGSISTGAQTVAGGMLYVNSGVGGVHQTGNALIAYSVDGK